MTDQRRPKQAAKTTIVGGQPPGNQRDLPPIPAGIEELLGMAAVDRRFADVLYEDPPRAIAASGVELSGTERAILDSVGQPVLQQMVGRLSVTEQDRRYFLGRSAAALVALVGGAAIASTSCRHPTDDPGPVTGARPDRPDEPARPEPARPEPRPAPGRRPELEVETGIRPDRPEPDPTAKGGARPDRPDAGKPRPPRPTRGIRPDRPEPPPKPPRPTRGIRPDRPRSKGHQPDRPRPKIRLFKGDEDE